MSFIYCRRKDVANLTVQWFNNWAKEKWEKCADNLISHANGWPAFFFHLEKETQ